MYTTHTLRRLTRNTVALPLFVLALCAGALPASAQSVVNIDATLDGYFPGTGPAPTVGDVIAPFSLAAGGTLDQLTLGPGTYTVTNATGLAGANPDFTAWRFDGGSSDWVWNYVIASDATDAVVNAGGSVVGPSQAAVASDPITQNYSSTFTLPQTTVLDFMVKDYYLPDNAGGVALRIQSLPTAVPEPSSFGLVALCLLPLYLVAKRKMSRRD